MIALLVSGLLPAKVLAGDPDRTAIRFVGVAAGLGIHAQSMADLADYVNVVAQPAAQDRLTEFNSVADLFLAPELQVADAWSVGVEYALHLRSFTVGGSQGFGASEFGYAAHAPLVFVHHLYAGEGYWLKVGGGVGYRWGRLSQKLFGSQEEVVFRAGGAAVKLEVVGMTRFDPSFWGTIGVDLHWGIGGAFRLPSGLEAAAGGVRASLPAFSVGLRFGIMIVSSL
jgi:hypothetical protein